ncbi:MAG: carbamate kinase [Actinobacteria bacterium]|nr:carbamate kinase [Actinomycetota bacterium]
MTSPQAHRIVIALGGNAIAGPDSADPSSQQAAVTRAAGAIAALVADGHEVVVTHGNGPQVGNLLLKNELTRDVVPPVPLDWCVAQTQATLGFLIVTALEAALREVDAERLVTALVTRVLVDGEDPAWTHPTKPIGQYVDEAQAREHIARGESWEDRGERGWRRIVPSPQPLEILERAAIESLLSPRTVIVAAGGGGIPMVREDGRLRGVEAVLDKDLTAALLARAVGAERLIIATDVEAAAIGFGTPDEERIGAVTPAALRSLQDQGHFASGSMGPKVEAALRFVEQGGRSAVITSLAHLREGAEGRTGTIVEPEE